MINRWKTVVIVSALLVGLVGLLAWYKLSRVVPQPAWITADERDNYLYGSVATGNIGGLPYWMWLAMPRMFPEYMPGPGGYAALGMSWEEGQEMPVGFAKQKVGYIRVTGNCALCHVLSRPAATDAPPTMLPVVQGHVTNIEPLLTFYRECAQDPRFNADEFFAEINNDTKLSILDSLLYRYVLIPRIRKALIDNPAAVLFSPALLAHSHTPESDEPFSDPQLKALRDWMKQQSQPVTQ